MEQVRYEKVAMLVLFIWAAMASCLFYGTSGSGPALCSVRTNMTVGDFEVSPGLRSLHVRNICKCSVTQCIVHNVEVKEEKEKPKAIKELAIVDVRSMLREDLSEKEKKAYEVMFAEFSKLSAIVDVRSMLGEDLSEKEKKVYEVMFVEFPKLFATKYIELQGAKRVEHKIVLKEGGTPKVQKLRRLGVIMMRKLFMKR
ncbi:hypothetical protein L7F22_035481 [Adiantum nelumboides]|nr:hypothetical protein [Adiantum nelumboides]